MKKRLIGFGLVAVLMFIPLFVAAGECSVCSEESEQTRAPCPFTVTLKCWCEDPPDWVCCLRRYCDVQYPGGPCTDCFTYEDCFFYYPCNGPYPKFADYFGGVVEE